MDILGGGLSDVIYTSAWVPDVPSTLGGTSDNPFNNLFANIGHAVGKVLPSWLRDTLGSFSSWFGWLAPILSAVFGVLVTVAPFLPLILIFYVVDAGVTSFSTGSIEPIGACFTSLYQLAALSINGMVSIAETVWSFIHFW